MDYSSLKKRYVGLDLFRVICAMATCAFHTAIHLGANYGILHPMIDMGAVFMTAFFMLSGFTLFVNYAGKDIIKKDSLKTFYLKRIVGIIPMYYVASLLYIIYVMVTQPDAIKTTLDVNLLLAPIEILGIQSNFSSLFGLTHNGGTWFISCILICYLVYPLLQEIAKQLSTRGKIIVTFVCVFVLLYSPFVIWRVGIASIYSNPFFRALEFTIGVMLAALKPKLDEIKFFNKGIYNWITIIAFSVLMVVGVTIAYKRGLHLGNYMMYSLICLPCFIVILLGLSGVKVGFLEKSKILSYCSGLTYPFFLAQLFSNHIAWKIMAKYAIASNWLIIILGWLVCIAIAILFHEAIEKPITKLLKKKLFVKKPA